MAIYKSTLNKKKKEQKQKPEKEVKEVKEKIVKVKKKANVALILLSVFAVLFLICVLPMNFAKSFLLGMFGLLVYPVSLIGIFFSLMKLKKRKYVARKKYITYLVCAVLTIWFIFHYILTSKIQLNGYGTYLIETYKAKTTAGGLLFSLISYPIVKYLTVVGAYVVTGIVLAIFIGLIIDYINVEREVGHADTKSKFDLKNIEEFEVAPEKVRVVTKEEENKKIAKRKLGLEKGETTILSSSMPKYEFDEQTEIPKNKREYILTPFEPIIPTEKEDVFENARNFKRDKSSQISNLDKETKKVEISPTPQVQEIKTEPVYVSENEEVAKITDEEEFLVDEDEEMEGYEPVFETDGDFDSSEEKVEPELTDLDEEYEEVESEEVEEIVADVDKAEYVDEYRLNRDTEKFGSTTETEVVRPSVDISKFNIPNMIKKDVVEEVKEEVVPTRLDIPPYVAPPVEFLNYLDNPVRISDEELQDNIERLEQVLEDFKVPAKVNNVQVGPAVTRYELTMPRGISVNKIAQMSDDIAMTLASNGAIRVEAPIPGKNSVGIEVPNAQVSPVSLRELIDSDEFRGRGNPLSFVLGRDINGDIIFCNLDKMPHVLVAGSTGSGKSVCLNTMLLSLCYKAGPQDLRLILVDPKMVEFTPYNGLPHLLIPEVITGKDMTINALDWAIKEMERRYAMFAKHRVGGIRDFNNLEVVKSGKEEKIPFIVVVVDELADLMLEAKREIDDRIAKIAAKARAAGIHLVLATQRPSVDVITGTVKANLPSRIAFALTNYMDSKTILDGGGAEKLLGKGDMLFKPQDKPEPVRVQGAYVSNAEIAKVVEFIKEKNKPVYDDNAGRAIKNPHQASQKSSMGADERELEFDPVLKEALRMFIQTKQASGSMISRRFSVGFNRAGRIMDQMERAGFIGPQEGAKPRQVLITMDEYNAIFNED
ncbi:MAG: hypothetical protein E7374_01130 [Clostridiales bacterium]|nr:hypothetical protein [Clostridiales bacterium]